MEAIHNPISQKHQGYPMRDGRWEFYDRFWHIFGVGRNNEFQFCYAVRDSGRVSNTNLSWSIIFEHLVIVLIIKPKSRLNGSFKTAKH